MTMTSDAFSVLRPKNNIRIIIIYLLSLPILAVLSSILGSSEFGITPESPGGTPLEIAFWATSLSAAFVSFMMVETLFRSRESRLLAPLPVEPAVLYGWQMRRVFAGIALSSLPYFACWLPYIAGAPLVIGLCMALWPVGLAVCAVVSAAVILYAGDAAARSEGPAGAAAMTFSSAPAIALAVSLVANLLLKLLAEALLKPGFADAAFTASALVFVLTAATAFYAHRLFKRRYYAILANFIDTDAIVINAAYDFLDGKTAARMRPLSPVSALSLALVEQFRRCHAVSSLILAAFAVILGIVLVNSPGYTETLFVPCLAAVPVLLFSKPWVALTRSDIETGLIESLPIAPRSIARARLAACLRIIAVPALLLTAAAALPALIHKSAAAAVLPALSTFVIIAGLSSALSFLSQKWPSRAAVFNYTAAAVCAVLMVIV